MATERLVGAKHQELTAVEKKELVQDWVSQSPQINSFIIGGNLVEFSEIKARTEEHPEAAEGRIPATELEGIEPLSKDFARKDEKQPERTSKRTSEITNKLAIVTLIRTHSQLNYGADLGYYPENFRRLYPVGATEGTPFTLPTSAEIVKKLLADHLRAKRPDEIEEGMSLEGELGMTGTELSRFEDELEVLGFERLGLDLATEKTVGDVVERLVRQEETLHELSAFVTFPKTRVLYETSREMDAVAASEETELMELRVSWSESFFRSMTEAEPAGHLNFEQQLGVPVITVESEVDFQALRPIAKRPIPANTDAYSFVVTRKSRLNPEGETQNFPSIVKREGVSDKITLQHARAQLAFARKISPDEFTPILVSKSPATENEDISLRVKRYLLSVLSEQTEPVDWGKQGSLERKRLLPKKGDLFSSGEPLYLGNWLTRRETVLGKSRKKEILGKVVVQVKRDIGVIARLVAIRPSMAWQGWVANYLSLFEDWEKAERMFKNWEQRSSFRDSFGELPPPSTDIFRKRPPQV